MKSSGFFEIQFRPIGPIDLDKLIVTSLVHRCQLSNWPDYHLKHRHKLYYSKSEKLDDINPYPADLF